MKLMIILTLGFSISYCALPIEKDREPVTVEYPLSKWRDLKIEFPSNFKLEVDYKDQGGAVIELIPQEEHIDDWIELISVLKYPFPRDPYDFVTLCQNLDTLPGKPTKNEIEFLIEKGVKIGASIVERPSNILSKGKLYPSDLYEIISTKAFACDYESIIVQYNYRFDPKDITEDKKQEMYKKINDFWSKCTISIHDPINSKRR